MAKTDAQAADQLAEDLEGLVATAKRVVGHAQSVSYLLLGLLGDVKTELETFRDRDVTLQDVADTSDRLIERIDFALAAHAYIEIGAGL